MKVYREKTLKVLKCAEKYQSKEIPKFKIKTYENQQIKKG
jgi:hypothetical protein